MATTTQATPQQTPPRIEGDGVTTSAPGTSAPRTITDEDLVQALAPSSQVSPTLAPPEVAEAAADVAAVAATWRSGTVTALWSINEIRNAWMHVGNVGWRKLYNGRDHAFTALVTLASQARQTGRTISFREEADGMVYEIYLW